MKLIHLLSTALISSVSFGQIGGTQTFQFLNFTNSARVESVGGYLMTVRDNDATLGVENPALINKSQHGFLGMNYVNYFADSDYGFTSYTRHFRDLGTFNTSLMFANYGKFQQTDVDGNLTGAQFTANDLVWSVGYGMPIDSVLSVGASIKGAASFMESYNAFGVSVDLGAVYYSESKGTGLALVIKNAGFQLNGYTDNLKEPIPLNIIFAASKKLAHAPFRFSLTYHNAQKWDLVYFDPSSLPTVDPLTGERIEVVSPGFRKKLMYHLTFGGEMLFSDNFQFRFGYNFKTRQDNAVAAKPGLTGFSWGIGMNVKRFNLSYGLKKYHIAGTSNHITITTTVGKPAPEDTFYRQER